MDCLRFRPTFASTTLTAPKVSSSWGAAPSITESPTATMGGLSAPEDGAVAGTPTAGDVAGTELGRFVVPDATVVAGTTSLAGATVVAPGAGAVTGSSPCPARAACPAVRLASISLTGLVAVAMLEPTGTSTSAAASSIAAAMRRCWSRRSLAGPRITDNQRPSAPERTGISTNRYESSAQATVSTRRSTSVG
jgi:hypothetical protein